ncbi:MAG TPA: YlbF family regulator [Firmicutes bacterium]|nr:YlbF family regulator [Bacillota bacterium]
MEPRVEKKARELAEELARSEACARLEKAKEEISKRAAAQIMMRDLEERQKRLQAKRDKGQQPTEAEIEEIQRMYQIAGMNPYIRALFDAQNELLAMIMAVQAMLIKAAKLEPETETEAEEEPATAAGQTGPTEQTGQKPRSRLWVPGGYR